MKVKTKKINWGKIKEFLIYCLSAIVFYSICLFCHLIADSLLNG